MATAEMTAIEARVQVVKRPNSLVRRFRIVREAFHIAMECILSNKMRSFLTLIGIIIGVASVMIVGAFISGMNTYVQDNISSMLGNNTFMVAQIMGTHMTDEEFEKKMRSNKRITPEEYALVAAQCKSAKVVAAETNRGRQDLRYKGKEAYDCTVTGGTSNAADIATFELAQGRFFQNFEVDACRNVVVLGAGPAGDLFPDEDPLGKQIKMLGTDFTVIGVFAKRGTFMGQSLDNLAYVPITVLDKYTGRRRGWTIKVKTDPENFDTAQEEVRSILRGARNLRPGKDDTFDFLSTDEINKEVDSFTGAVAGVVTPITLISLVVGGIVIMNIMLVSVTERTREIGIRKAIGARRKDLLLQFLLESGILGILGGGIGVGISYLLCLAIHAATDFTLTITSGYIMLSLIISGGIGILAGMYPAWKAARLDPIKALSFES